MHSLLLLCACAHSKRCFSKYNIITNRSAGLTGFVAYIEHSTTFEYYEPGELKQKQDQKDLLT